VKFHLTNNVLDYRLWVAISQVNIRGEYRAHIYILSFEMNIAVFREGGALPRFAAAFFPPVALAAL
jgi:hypothetical protein